MVSQQKFLVPIWGESSHQKIITLTVSWNKKEYRTTSDEDGKWRFDIAGPDHKFVWADAKIEGNTVVVSSPHVQFPMAVH